MINFKVLTLFPELFPGPLAASITGIALKKKIWFLEAINIRNYAKDKHAKVDDIPYGGGAGMVLKPDIIADALLNVHPQLALKSDATKPKIFCLSARGKIFNQKMACSMAEEKEIILLCGRYEGIDQRVLDEFAIEEISIGGYVLSGGEIAAYVVIDTILRNVEGVLGTNESLTEESFGSKKNPEFENLLEYPHFTRPQEWRGRLVPEVLISGNHKKIQQWRRKQAIAITKQNRPDLWSNFLKTPIRDKP
jgi:tRNA (guanine37-N1)-methyltransferase